jgi:hypothetical protein
MIRLARSSPCLGSRANQFPLPKMKTSLSSPPSRLFRADLKAVQENSKFRQFCSRFLSSGPQTDTPSFFKKVLTLYSVLLGANFISNVLIHPTAKLDYGILNRLWPDDREVNSPFWSTRLPHLVIIPATLAAFDLSVTHLFTKFGGLVSYSQTPTPWLLNLYLYTFLAVGSFIAFDASLNPKHEGRRWEQFSSHLKPLTIGMGLQWHAGMVMATIGSATATGPLGIIRNAFAVSLIFLPVKALGFGDMGETGLSPHERKMNGLPPKEQAH